MRSILNKLAPALLLLASLAPVIGAADNPAIFPLDDVKPGMKGVVYTIFSGDQIEKVDLEVIGILRNALGPKEDVILVKLLGDKADQTGVAAGMSGSPVYFDGRLAGALSLKLGNFTKEAIGGVTPIEEMLQIPNAAAPTAAGGNASPSAVQPQNNSAVAIPQNFLTQTSAGGNQFLIPIETPLISSGLFPQTMAQFASTFSSWGVSMMAGGVDPPSPADAAIKPGDMVGIDMVRGDLSISSGCTVTSVTNDQVLACGHPVFNFGSIAMPMSRAHVLMTLASSNASTKVISTAGTIGTLTDDRSTAVMGKLGPGPSMIPVDVALQTAAGEKKYHFEVIESPQLTPTLVAVAAYNGL